MNDPENIQSRLFVLEQWKTAMEQWRLAREDLEKERRKLDEERHTANIRQFSALDKSINAINNHLASQDVRGEAQDKILTEVLSITKGIEIRLAKDAGKAELEKENEQKVQAAQQLNAREKADNKAFWLGLLSAAFLLAAVIVAWYKH